MTYTFDIAAILTAIMWPLAFLIVLLAYRKKFPALIEALASRVIKLGVAGFEMELAAAKPYQPESDKTAGASEFWHKANHTQVNDSYATTFFNQLAIKRSPSKPQTKSKQTSIKTNFNNPIHTPIKK